MRKSGQRIASLDAARGIAMLLVCLSHFMSIHFVGEPARQSWLDVINYVSKVATPAFVLVSGILMGYQVETGAANSSRFRMQVLDRALFLVTVGHILIALAFVPRWGAWRALSSVYITDTLAFCMVIGLLMAPRMSRQARLIVGGGTTLGSWFVWQLWAAQDPLPLLIKSVFIGPPEGTTLIFPLLPWLGWYLVGSAIGGQLHRSSLTNRSRSSWRLGAIGLGMIVVAFAIRIAVKLHGSFAGATFDTNWDSYVSLLQKYPPGPIYMLAMGGAALVLLSVLFSPKQPSWLKSCVSLAEPIGQNSLAIFIVQFFLYFAACDLLVAKGAVVPLMVSGSAFLLSLVGIWVLARLCQRYRASRVLTTGLPVFLHSLEPARAVREFRHAA